MFHLEPEKSRVFLLYDLNSLQPINIIFCLNSCLHRFDRTSNYRMAKIVTSYQINSIHLKSTHQPRTHTKTTTNMFLHWVYTYNPQHLLIYFCVYCRLGLIIAKPNDTGTGTVDHLATRIHRWRRQHLNTRDRHRIISPVLRPRASKPIVEEPSSLECYIIAAPRESPKSPKKRCWLMRRVKVEREQAG